MDPLLKYFLTAKEHPFEIGVGLLTTFGTHFALKAFRRANAFRQLDGPTPSSSLWGDEALLYDIKTSLTIHDELLNRYGSVCKVKGPLGEDRVWIADPRALSDIVVKGFDDFHEVEGFVAWFALTQGPTIITTSGHKHKMQRKILNPVFTPLICVNTPTFNSIAHHLSEIVTSEVRTSGGNTAVVDIHHWMSNVSLEMIGQAGMGHSFGVMTGKEPEYIEASRQLFPLISEMWYIRPFLPALMKVGSAGFRRFVVSYIPFGPVQRLRNITETMDKTAAGIYNQKKRALEEGTLESEIAAGNDIMSMMLKQNKNVPPEDQMNEAEIQAQVKCVYAFSKAISYSIDFNVAVCCSLDMTRPESRVQYRLREEVREAHGLHGKSLDYDQLNSLQYLDAVCRESLRLWAPGQLVERTAGKDWNLPLRYPVKSKDGKTMISNLHIKKGTHLYLSLGSVNRDKQTWGDDADQFKPARWLTPLPGSVADSKIPGVYSNIMTFLGGPRSCIFETGPEEHFWVASGVLKPHTQRDDGTIDSISSLRLKITLVDD
ncbi:cytochrome P450 [Rhizoctonia solani]|uniref:Cytochrome P450 n=1 Tax=Rhizoctonia solani TaxID=456999 RepID=A0A8H7I8M0_9AGAM|nr:cytochrome P450 [Rhizoctonia solani]